MNTVIQAQPAPIVFSDAQRTGITDEDLDNDELVVYISPLREGKEGDTIELWLSESLAESAGEYLEPTFPIDDPDRSTQVAFTRAQLVKLNDRRVYFAYRVNGGEIAERTGIDVSVTAKR